MKTKLSFRSLAMISTLFATPFAHAANYYWDTNSTGAGLGDTAGTWGTSTFLGTVSSAAVLNGTASTANTATNNADAIYFGTNNLALGSTASTIGIVGTNVTINTIVFGSGQASQGVTLSSGGGSIALAGNAPSASPTITANNNGTNTVAAVLTGTVGMVKGGAGSLTLTASNSFTGGLTIAGGGTLQVGNGSSGSLASQALTFNNGSGVFNVQAAGSGSTQAMGALTFSTTGAGEGRVQSTYGSSGNAALSFTSLAARGAGAVGNFVISGGSNGTTNKISITGATSGILLNRGLFFNGSSYAAYDAAGFVRAYGSGDTDFLSVGPGTDMGFPALTDNVALTGSLTAQGDAAVNTINMGAHSIAMDASGFDLLLDTNGILSSGSGSATIGGGTTPRLRTSTISAEMVIRVDGASDALYISSIIQNNGTTPLTKSGAGTLTLSGENTYSGTTTVSAGTLALSGGAAIVNSGTVVLANAPSAKLLLNDSETIGSLSGGGFSGGNVDVGNKTLTISAGSNFGGRFIGTGEVSVPSGTLTLSNRNTFAGTISLTGSGQLTFTLGNDGSAAPAPVSSGGTISMAGGTAINLNPAANVAGGVATPMLNNNAGGLSFTNPINITSGTATVQTTAATGANDWKWHFSGGVTGATSGAQTLAIAPGGFIAPGQGDRQNLLFSGIIADGIGGTLGVSVDFKAGSGTGQEQNVNLSAQNTFTGPIVTTNTRGLVFAYTGPTANNTGGFLSIGGESNRSFTFGRSVTAGSGYLGGGNYTNTISLATGTALNYISSANQTLGGVISGGGNLIMDRSAGSTVGTLTLEAANTYSGITVINSGILWLKNALSIQNSAIDTTYSATGNATNGLKIATTTLTIGGLSGNKNFASIFETNADGGPDETTSLGGYSGLTALTLNPQSGSSVTYTASIADATSGMTVTKTGAGTQILSGTNTYTGVTTVNAGTLVLSGSNASSGYVVNGGTLQVARPSAQPASGVIATSPGSTFAINVGGVNEWTTATSGNGSIGGLLSGLGGQSGGTVTFSGAANIGFDPSNALTTPVYAGAIGTPSGATTLGISKLGSNTMVLSGSNTYAGGTTITAGTLQFAKLVSQPASGAVAVGTGATLALNLGGAGEWTTGTSGNGTMGGLLAGLGGQSGSTVSYTGNVNLGFDTTNAGSAQTYSGIIANVGTALGITKLGSGTLVLDAANTYTGATTVNGGTLLLDKTGSGDTAGLAATSPLVLGGGNFLMKGKTSGTTTQTLGALTLTANSSSTITLDANGGTGTTLTLASAAPTRGVGSTLLIDRSIANTTLTSTLGLTAAAQTVNQGIRGYAVVKDGASSFGYAVNVGGNIVRYSGAEVMSGSAPSTGANVKTVPTGTSVTGTPYLTTSASPTYNSLSIDTSSATGANFLSLNGTVSLSQGSILFTGSNHFTIQGGTQLGANNTEVIVHQFGSGILTLSSKISAGSGSLTKAGPGTLIVTNSTNAYTGNTVVSAGTVQYASRTAFGTSTLYLNGGTRLQKITEEGNSAALTMANNIILTGGQVELNVDFTNAKDQWCSGVISGTGSLRITAGGGVGRAVTLTGNNTFSGGVTLDTTTTPGWIQLGNANGLGVGTLTINHTGGNAAQGLGASTNLTVGTGVANNIVINSGATLNLGGPVATGNVLLSGVISGGGSLNKQDAAATTFTLAGANTYTGTTRVASGTLALGASNVLPNTSNITLAGATINASTFTDTAGTLAVSGTATINLGSGGALAFANSSAVSWSGTLNITGTFVSGSSIRFGTTNAGLTPSQLASISVNGTGAGTYALNADGYLIVAPSSPYITWAGIGVDFDADANKDGVSNGMAWVLGAADEDTNASGLVPTIDNSDAIYFIFNFRRKDEANTDAATTIITQYSTTLTGWTTAVHDGSDIIITPSNDFYATGVDKVEVKIKRTLAPGGKLFVRLKTDYTP